ncbi:MAG: preprotein translocase subunit SecA [Coriobacteriales bacterium]|nr:preprotein translocase subunit SecA [Coriobacteriales bacterium]
MPGLFSRILSMGSDKQLKEFRKIAARVNELEPQFQKMGDAELKHQTALFKERHQNGESLDSLLPEAFASVREASQRTIGQRHFDVQLVGGIALHKGTIAEMKTGEGKTLVSTLSGYLNAISGEGVHIVTVNDYLAKRDSEWMGRIYNFMGMSVGLLQNGMKLGLKRPAYAADVTYGTNSEFGFDYLRDNMVTRANMRVQRGHHYAIVDEVDSILIDEARTPLIISGAGTKSASTYQDFAAAVRGLVADEDYEMDEAKHTIAATEKGLEKIERALGIDDIYGDMSGELVNHLQQALKAEYMFHRDQQYAVIDGEVKIVDEFTGRIMEGRRYSEGLHQAIEAKEGVYVREENQTLATITLQNYFRLYEKLSGMTGTAMTEDAEFREIYNLPVQVIPPNREVIRKDNDDLVYRTIDAKFEAVADSIAERHAKGQPCLVGTVSIENSEKLSGILNRRGIPHSVLNAKYHEREAQIVAQAGREGAVTIATNMAGRGTDILLGGNAQVMATDLLAAEGISADEVTEQQRAAARARADAICEEERKHVLAAGGLCVIGTERHESRRIDNQLRGRSGRQGDPGETQFYLSLEDDLMRLFGGDRMDRISAMMQRYDMPDDMPIQAKMVTKAVEGAQRKVEEINFAMRKNVLEYDDVMNKQRRVIYEERNKILDGKDLTEHVNEVTADTVWHRVSGFCPDTVAPEEWDLEGLKKWLIELTGKKEGLPEFSWEDEPADISQAVEDFVHACYQEKTENLGDNIMHELSTQVMLRVIDTRWMAYLQEMDYLKTGIGLRGFGQRDPLVEYKSEAYLAFSELVNTMYEDFLRTILRIEVQGAPMRRAAAAASEKEQQVDEEPEELKGARYSGPAEVDGDQSMAKNYKSAPVAQAPMRSFSEVEQAPDQAKRKPYRKAESEDPFANVGRNDPCPCGSGKKFKNCHGRRR